MALIAERPARLRNSAPPADAASLPVARPLLERVRRYTLREIRREAIWWLPLRVFIGIGWLRACTEKAQNPHWLSGSSLTDFLVAHQPSAVFPAYAALIQGLFLPNALLLAWVVMIAQASVGLLLVLGWQTRAALLAGLAMNFNFVIAGEPNPSAFYIVMQLALLGSRAGRIFALDAMRKPRVTAAWSPATRLWVHLLIGVPLFVVAISSLKRIRDFSPAGSVKDPAAILAVLSVVALSYLLIETLRLLYPAPRRRTRLQ